MPSEPHYYVHGNNDSETDWVKSLQGEESNGFRETAATKAYLNVLWLRQRLIGTMRIASRKYKHESRKV